MKKTEKGKRGRGAEGIRGLGLATALLFSFSPLLLFLASPVSAAEPIHIIGQNETFRRAWDKINSNTIAAAWMTFATNWPQSNVVSGTEWIPVFYGLGQTSGVALLSASDLAASLGGSATNAIGTIKSNGVTLATGVTSLDFVQGSNTVVRMTNTAGAVTVQINAAAGGAGGSATNAIAIEGGAGNNTTLTNPIARTQLAVNGRLEATNGPVVIGHLGDPQVFTNYNDTHQRAVFWMTDAGNSMKIRDGAFIDVENGGAIILGDDGTANRLQLHALSYLTSVAGAGDSSEIFRYRFWNDSTGNDSNRVQRFWEVSNYVATAGGGTLPSYALTNNQSSATTFSNNVTVDTLFKLGGVGGHEFYTNSTATSLSSVLSLRQEGGNSIMDVVNGDFHWYSESFWHLPQWNLDATWVNLKLGANQSHTTNLLEFLNESPSENAGAVSAFNAAAGLIVGALVDSTVGPGDISATNRIKARHLTVTGLPTNSIPYIDGGGIVSTAAFSGLTLSGGVLTAAGGSSGPSTNTLEYTQAIDGTNFIVDVRALGPTNTVRLVQTGHAGLIWTNVIPNKERLVLKVWNSAAGFSQLITNGADNTRFTGPQTGFVRSTNGGYLDTFVFYSDNTNMVLGGQNWGARP